MAKTSIDRRWLPLNALRAFIIYGCNSPVMPP